MLLHAFYKNQFICPDKRDRRVNSKQDSTEEDIIKQNESSFSGGLVLEPKPGLYKKYVLLLDFNSLYPSIIQEYNVCHTTMNLQKIGANVGDCKLFMRKHTNKINVGNFHGYDRPRNA